MPKSIIERVVYLLIIALAITALGLLAAVPHSSLEGQLVYQEF